jgi:hypothetical protein
MLKAKGSQYRPVYLKSRRYKVLAVRGEIWSPFLEGNLDMLKL